MDPLEYAIRRYRELAPAPDCIERYQSIKLKDLQHWLENEVCQAVDTYLGRAKFQQEASWAIRTLTRGTLSNERKAVEEVDDSLVDAARRLVAIVNQPQVHQQLCEDNPPIPHVDNETVVISDTQKYPISRETELRDFITIELEQLKQISNRFWDDLAFAGDYFAPRGGWFGSRQKHQFGEFMVSFNRALPTVGDMISACLLHRVNLLYDELKRFRNKCLSTLFKLSPIDPKILHECKTVLENLEHKISKLKELVQVNPQTPRSACIALTQLFLVFNPASDASWLGLDEPTLLDGPPSLRAHLTNQRNVEFYDAVAVSLTQLKLLYQNEPANQSALEESIATGNLVINEKAKMVYWESKSIDFDWKKYPKLWKLLITLARATRFQKSVNDQDVYGDLDEPNMPGALTQLVSRLKRELPDSLRVHVKAGQAKNSYLLTLHWNHVHFIK